MRVVRDRVRVNFENWRISNRQSESVRKFNNAFGRCYRIEEYVAHF